MPLFRDKEMKNFDNYATLNNYVQTVNLRQSIDLDYKTRERVKQLRSFNIFSYLRVFGAYIVRDKNVASEIYIK